MRGWILAMAIPGAAWAACPTDYAAHGDGCVHPSASVDPGAVLGLGATVHAGATVGASTLLAGAQVGPKAWVGDGATVGGVVGRRARVGDGATVPDGSTLARASAVGPLVIGTGAMHLGYAAQVHSRATLGDVVRVGNLAVIDGSADLGDNTSVGRGAHVGAGAEVEGGAAIGPDARLAPTARALSGSRIARGAFLGWGAVAHDNARIGRGATLRAGAHALDGAAVRAGAIVGAGASVGTGDTVPRGGAVADLTPGAVIADVVLASGGGEATMGLPYTFLAQTGVVELTALTSAAGGEAVAVAWTPLQALPAGWSLSGEDTATVQVSAPSPGTAYLTLSATSAGGAESELVRVTTVDLPPTVPIVDVGGGVLGYADGTVPTLCDGYKHGALPGYEVATADGVYRTDPLDSGAQFPAACEMDLLGGGWTLVRRRSAAETIWHPVNDQARGTQSYGSYVPDALHSTSFSMAYAGWPYAEMVFATGDQQRWVQVARAVIDSTPYTASGGCTTTVTMTTSWLSPTAPSTAAWCMRTGQPEDPWISARDHGAVAESATHSMVYGESSYNAWHTYRAGRQGANVWVR